MKKKGRPSKLDAETKNKLLGSIVLGLSYVDSCIMAGIHYKTLQGWIKRGEAENGKEYISFLADIKRAKISGKAKNIKIIKEDKSWQSKAWLLERQHPNEFGKIEDVKKTENIEDKMSEFINTLEKKELE